MSSIGAVLSRHAALDAGRWSAMAQVLERHGPDGQQVCEVPGAPLGLVQSLLAITPQDQVAGSTACSPDGRWQLIADARLDARESLVQRLQLPGPMAAAFTDVQLIAHAFGQWQGDAPL